MEPFVNTSFVLVQWENALCQCRSDQQQCRMSKVLLAIGRSRPPFDSYNVWQPRSGTHPNAAFCLLQSGSFFTQKYKHSKTQDFGWAPHTHKKSFERFAFAISDDVVRDKFCKFREGRSDVHWKAFDTLFVPIFGPEPKPTKLEVFPWCPPKIWCSFMNFISQL